MILVSNFQISPIVFVLRQGSCNSGWPQAGYVIEDDLELLMLLPPPPKLRLSLPSLLHNYL